MPVHDWTRVTTSTFHDFHNTWIVHLKTALNDGLLPKGYYALTEQHSGGRIADVLTLGSLRKTARNRKADGGIAIAPSRSATKLVANENAAYRALRRTVTVRHTSQHHVVAMIEIVSPANKDRPKSVAEFVKKTHQAMEHGCNVLVADVLPSGRHDPRGMHGAIWAAFDSDEYNPPDDRPLTFASYVALKMPIAYVEHLRVDQTLPNMPLFLRRNLHVSLPLESTYTTAYDSVPEFYRDILEGREPPPA